MKLPWLMTLFLLSVSCAETAPGNETGEDASPLFDAGLDASGSTLFTVTTDFETGSFSVYWPATGEVQKDIGAAHSDAVAVTHGGLVYVINRLGQDNITLIDPSKNYSPVAQYSTGPGSNPQDMAFDSEGMAYISLYDKPEILIVEPGTGKTSGTIDLASWADADGLPETSGLAVTGERLLAALQRLDRKDLFKPDNTSLVALIDIRTRKVDGAIELQARNPFTDILVESADRALVGCAGEFGKMDGQIEIIDPEAGKSLGPLFTEEELGGDIDDFILTGPGQGAVVASDASFNTRVVLLSWKDKKSVTEIYRTEGYNLAKSAFLPPSYLAISDRTIESPGLRIFDLSASPTPPSVLIDVGLPPYCPVVVELQ